MLLVPAVVVLVGLTAFGLGRLSAIEGQRGTLKVYQSGVQAASAVLGASTASSPKASASTGEGVYVASKNGSKYYLPSCSGAKRINEENKIWFPTKEAAEASGYGPAANCPGL